MKKNELKTRDEISNEYKWNIEAMYPDESLLEEDLSCGISLADEFAAMQGHIADSADTLYDAISNYESAIRHIEKAFVYSHMKRDEDNSNASYTELYSKVVSVYTQIMAKTSFFTPELLESSVETIMAYVDAKPELEKYRFMLEQMMLQKEHTLSKEQEYIMSSLSEALSAPDEIFTVLNDVDMVFGSVRDENGTEHALTHGTYIHLLESPSRDIRKEAYTKLYDKYKEFNNTISTIYNFNVKEDVITSSLRNYSSCLDSALSGNRIPESVYTNLIDAVHKALPSMHKYMEIRKRVLGLDELKMYDVHVPIAEPDGASYSFEDAVATAAKALEPLGEEYVSILENGLLNEKWVDIYENKGKTSGAYSFGSYDSYPYILMNFMGELRDIFTLVHEGGHSMHSYYTRRTQPYIYGDHSIFTAEVASTVNETLLIRYLLDNCKDDKQRAYLINFYIDEFKSTLFRQTMFAEFELIVHKKVEEGGSLTAEFLNSTYNELNNMYFGSSISEDDMIQYEWSRIPHFYRSFYVYQYATGYSAANAIANRILTLGETARDDYLKFLTTGSSDYPIELLKIAGVDMSTEEPVLSALSTFSELVDELDELMRG